MDNLVEILHLDLSEAADIISSDCSHEQSKEVQSGWNCDDESRWITILGSGYEDLIVRSRFSRVSSGRVLPLVPVTLCIDNPDNDYSVFNKFLGRKLGEATGIMKNLIGIQFELNELEVWSNKRGGGWASMIVSYFVISAI